MQTPDRHSAQDCPGGPSRPLIYYYYKIKKYFIIINVSLSLSIHGEKGNGSSSSDDFFSVSSETASLQHKKNFKQKKKKKKSSRVTQSAWHFQLRRFTRERKKEEKVLLFYVYNMRVILMIPRATIDLWSSTSILIYNRQKLTRCNLLNQILPSCDFNTLVGDGWRWLEFHISLNQKTKKRAQKLSVSWRANGV